MEEEYAKQMEELEFEKIFREKEMEFQRVLKEKRMEMEKELREKELTQEKLLLDRALQEKTEHFEKMKTMRLSYQSCMDGLDQEMVNMKKVNEEMQPKKAEISPTPGVSGKQRELRKLYVAENALFREKSGVRNMSRVGLSTKAKDSSSEDAVSGTEDEYEEDDSEDEGDSEGSACRSHATTYGLGRQQTGPTKSQLAARNGVSKKLPVFTGKPEDWPLFYGTYVASNEACGFSDVENLVRLQESLKGPALESVRGQLILPRCVPKIIDKLRQLYGRPELILQSHLERIRKLEPPKPDRLATFVPFGNAIEQLCEHLEAANLQQHMVNPILIQDLVDKLPANDKREWVRFKRTKKRVTLRTFTDFVASIVEEACEANVCLDQKQEPKAMRGNRGSSDGSRARIMEKGVVMNHDTTNSIARVPVERTKLKACKACQRTDHRLRFCEDFRKLAYADRMNVVTRWKLCDICLNDHGNASCKFKIRCDVGGCQQRHNPLLHPVGSVVGTSIHIRTASSILFRIIPVRLFCGDKAVTTLAFLDEGASVTMIENELADYLGVVGVPERLTITWTADIFREEKGARRVSVWSSAIDSEERLLLNDVYTVESLRLPVQSLDAAAMSKQYRHLQNLPITSYREARPGMLIGLNNLHSFAPIEAKWGAPGEPIAVRCKLGWTVYGPRKGPVSSTKAVLGFHEGISNENLHDLIKTHYALDESVVTVKMESRDDERALSIMRTTTKRIGNRFETGLLWKTDHVKFPNSYEMAVRRLLHLERKLEKDPELYENVRKQVEEYQQKGYAHLVTEEEISRTDPEQVWYLPLNVVLNPRKPGKVRLVWDAAATFQRYVLWTDSQTVRSWILSDQHKFKQFVAFRIGEVLELTRSSDWRWVPSKLNAADILTKWGRGPCLESDGYWFTGPRFLLDPEEHWPSQAIPVGETEQDVRAVVLHHRASLIGEVSTAKGSRDGQGY
ncbi:uncharacterized protein LOC134286105 [Aedes albopictus]|uniref:Peptidase A2 domain-containing protein n=1 Tax=Aedes albopictus TaxID=7160 RepID=A0ABM1Z8Q1_AEDAL